MQGKTDMSHPWPELILEHMFQCVKGFWFDSPRMYLCKYREFAGDFEKILPEYTRIIMRMDRYRWRVNQGLSERDGR